MRTLDVDCGQYYIVENDNYKLFLARKRDGSRDHQQLGLYRVEASRIVGGDNTSFGKKESLTVYVIAESDHAAKGQATCHKVLKEWEGAYSVEAESVPLMLRGWSGHVFPTIETLELETS